MTHGIPVVATYESFDEAIVKELKSYLEGLLDDPWTPHHDYGLTLKSVDAYMTVTSDYLRSQEWNDYKATIQSKYDSLVLKAFPKSTFTDMEINVYEVREMPDGSANIHFTTNNAAKEFLVGVGLQKVLMDAAGEVLSEDGKDVPGWDYYDSGEAPF
jgi:hypothetical protein